MPVRAGQEQTPGEARPCTSPRGPESTTAPDAGSAPINRTADDNGSLTNIESTADVLALGEIVDRKADEKSLAATLRADGLGTAVSRRMRSAMAPAATPRRRRRCLGGWGIAASARPCPAHVGTSDLSRF
ncbi:hypothetical protein GCM10017674_60290 [Streptomyces gardneri]|uniref:Uncharacterized protein n=1 Tax=Streptomyces gardneri TaxID=66892 RepID=A0A4Y3RIU2_9ACTN|nr:hypothetical protein SGA01_28940 [Streptomyces gardneri]GHH13241.1 hypothetical protein GCM10017674_60290 [Streptomyces gardneri]